jgi:hypothetical protein
MVIRDCVTQPAIIVARCDYVILVSAKLPQAPQVLLELTHTMDL